MQTRGNKIWHVWCASIAAALLIVVGGCSKADDAAATPVGLNSAKSAAPYGGAAEARSDFPSAVGGMTQASPFSGAPAPMHDAVRLQGAPRSVLRSAVLAVDVENLDKSEKQMKQAIKDAGGYVDHEEGDNLASETPVLRLTIRVPEKTFDDVLTGFEALGHRTQKSISASDLTEQILDAEAQLQAEKQAPIDGARLPERIKQLEAERDTLAARAAMSTIDLTLQQKPNAGLATAASASWGSDTWNAALSSSLNAFRVVGAVAIWLLAYSPIWAPICIGSLWLYRSRRRAHVASRAQVA